MSQAIMGLAIMAFGLVLMARRHRLAEQNDELMRKLGYSEATVRAQHRGFVVVAPLACGLFLLFGAMMIVGAIVG